MYVVRSSKIAKKGSTLKSFERQKDDKRYARAGECRLLLLLRFISALNALNSRVEAGSSLKRSSCWNPRRTVLPTLRKMMPMATTHSTRTNTSARLELRALRASTSERMALCSFTSASNHAARLAACACSSSAVKPIARPPVLGRGTGGPPFFRGRRWRTTPVEEGLEGAEEEAEEAEDEEAAAARGEEAAAVVEEEVTLAGITASTGNAAAVVAAAGAIALVAAASVGGFESCPASGLLLGDAGAGAGAGAVFPDELCASFSAAAVAEAASAATGLASPVETGAAGEAVGAVASFSASAMAAAAAAATTESKKGLSARAVELLQ